MKQLPELAVSLGLWQDRPPQEALATAEVADRLGFAELWVGEVATYDAFALATAIGQRTRRVPLTVGPLAVAVRDPAMIARGAASVAELARRPVGVALGASNPTVVAGWHGRSYSSPATALTESSRALATLLAGDRADLDGAVLATHGYRLRLPPPHSRLTLAAFGPAAIRTASRYADRMVMSLVTTATAARLTGRLGELTDRAGREPIRTAAWVPAAVDPDDSALEQVRGALVGYLGAAGYSDMFTEAGFGELVEFARRRPHPRDLRDAIPEELIRAVSAVGDTDIVSRRLREYGASVDQVAVLPCCTQADPAGERTLQSIIGIGGDQ